MINTTKWDDRVSDIIQQLSLIKDSTESDKIKAKKLLDINHNLKNVLADFDTSTKFANMSMWEAWVNEYIRLTAMLSNISKEISYITSDIIGSDIDEDSALNLIYKFMTQNGYVNNGDSFVKGDSVIKIADTITDDYIDCLINQVRG